MSNLNPYLKKYIRKQIQNDDLPSISAVKRAIKEGKKVVESFSKHGSDGI